MWFLEHLDIAESSWEDVSGLFAGELPSLKKLNMSKCQNLKTDSMESIGMIALGILRHVSFADRFIMFDIMRRSKYSTFQLGGRQRSFCRQVPSFEKIGHVWMPKIESGFYGLHWNEGFGYIATCFNC